MKSVSIWNMKGGVGKSTVSVNLAANASYYYGKKVLLVDCDAQGNSSSYLDISGEHAEETSLTDYFTDGVALMDIVKHYEYSKVIRGKKYSCEIDAVPCNGTLRSVELTDINSLGKLIDGAEYDLVFFDCPPSDSDITISALAASDYVLVPAIADSDSLSGFQSLVDMVNQIKEMGHEITIVGIVLNMFAKTEALDKYIQGQLQEIFPDLVFPQVIRRSAIVKQCRYDGSPLCIKAETTPVGKDYKAVTQEFMRRIGEDS